MSQSGSFKTHAVSGTAFASQPAFKEAVNHTDVNKVKESPVGTGHLLRTAELSSASPTFGAPLVSVGTILVTEKEIKKINKEVQQQIKKEALFNAKQEALLNAKKNLQLGMTEVIAKGIPKELLREEQEQK